VAKGDEYPNGWIGFDSVPCFFKVVFMASVIKYPVKFECEKNTIALQCIMLACRHCV